ncbi:hypothetical protein YC2023_085604 [Brassica napus]
MNCNGRRPLFHIAQLAHPLETVTSFFSHDAFSVSSLRSWTIHLLNGKSINRLHSIYVQ